MKNSVWVIASTDRSVGADLVSLRLGRGTEVLYNNAFFFSGEINIYIEKDAANFWKG